MSIIGRILLLVIFNLLLLTGFVIKLIRAGNSYPQALQVAWNRVIADQAFPNKHNLPYLGWITLLKNTWWLMILVYTLFWIITPELDQSLILIFLILLHFYWYWQARTATGADYNRTYYLNNNWGILYQEIKANSEFESKSLAELDLRKKNLLVLAVEREGQLIPFPKGVEVLSTGDRLVIFGDLQTYQALIN